MGFVFFIIVLTLIATSIIIYILTNKGYKQFKKDIQTAKYVSCNYDYEYQLIPNLYNIYEVIKIKNGWIELMQIKSMDDKTPYFNTKEESTIFLPLKEAYQVLNLQIIE